MLNKLSFKRKLFYFVFIDLILIGALISYFGFYKIKVTTQIHGTYMPHPLAFSDFKLEDSRNQLLTTKALIGHWSILYFGFTSCPSICPTTLTQVNKFYQQLPEPLRPEVVFISVDPQKDTMKKIKTYVRSFNSAFIGARAEINEVIRLQKSLHLSINSENPLNHSMDLVLINPKGKIQAYFTYPQTAQYLKEDYLSILNNSGF